jgi:hypothetical protein
MAEEEERDPWEEQFIPRGGSDPTVLPEETNPRRLAEEAIAKMHNRKDRDE